MSKQANAGTPACVRLCACVCVLVRVSISSGIINKLHTCLATENVGLCVWGSYGHRSDLERSEARRRRCRNIENIFQKIPAAHSAGAIRQLAAKTIATLDCGHQQRQCTVWHSCIVEWTPSSSLAWIRFERGSGKSFNISRWLSSRLCWAWSRTGTCW